MMKLHVCPSCKYRALTSRRTECVCKTCRTPMSKVDTVGFEEWWQMDEEKRNAIVEAFLTKENPA